MPNRQMDGQLPSTQANRQIGLRTDLYPEKDVLFVYSLEGTEAISRPYRFDLTLLSESPDLPSGPLLKAHSQIRMKLEADAGITTIHLHGVFSTFQFQGMVKNKQGKVEGAIYRATLVPRISRLAQSTRSQTFLDKSVLEIAAQLMKEAELSEQDFEFRMDPYPKLEYVVQYQESDLDFLSRLLEHEGIFYYFDHGGDQEKIVFGDRTAAFGRLWTPAEYRTAAAADPKGGTVPWFDDEVVRAFSFQHKLVPREVVLRDYNPKTPDVDLTVTAPTGAEGTGVAYIYGEHFATLEEGKRLAQLRAEELRSRERTCTGAGNVHTFRAGHLFTLRNHDRHDLNREYLITEVRHVATQSISPAGEGAGAMYGNQFGCVASDVPFRPARVTPKPKVPGVVSARVGGEGKYAEIDDQGSYKQKMLFDRGGGASPPVRMSQTYEGMHFPLHGGIEALVTHVDGNPDRPVLAGVVPNAKTTSPVTGQNHTQGILHSHGNNAILFEDLEDSERLLLHAQRDHETLVRHDVYEWIGNDRHLIVKNDQIEHVENNRHEKIDGDLIQEVAGNVHLQLNGNQVIDIGGKSCVVQDGAHYLKAPQIVLEATSGITLKCGSNSIVLDAKGVSIQGTITKINSGASPANGELLSPQKPLEAKEPKDLAVGSLHWTNTGAGAPPPVTATDDKPSWIRFELKDDDGKPVPFEPYEIRIPNGAIVRGRLDKDGKAKIEGIKPGSCDITFPRIDKGKWKKG